MSWADERGQALELGALKGERGGSGVVLDVAGAGGAGNRHDEWPGREQPRKRNLRGGGPVRDSDLLDLGDESEVLLEVGIVEARIAALRAGIESQESR